MERTRSNPLATLAALCRRHHLSATYVAYLKCFVEAKLGAFGVRRRRRIHQYGRGQEFRPIWGSAATATERRTLRDC